MTLNLQALESEGNNLWFMEMEECMALAEIHPLYDGTIRTAF
jgi:hypothetical protein